MFQKQVFITPAKAVEGDFASTNPRIYQISANGFSVADASGVQVGTFAVLNDDGTVTSVPGDSDVKNVNLGFVHREVNAQIVTYLAESSMTIQPGEPVALFNKGDFWARVGAISGEPARGDKVLWDKTSGSITVGGDASGSLVDTGWVLLSASAEVGDVVIISNVVY